MKIVGKHRRLTDKSFEESLGKPPHGRQSGVWYKKLKCQNA
jgi:hypothetical protein